MEYKTALFNFKNTQEYQSIKKILLSEKPNHIVWDQINDNTEGMKYRSAMIDGYLLALKKLGIDPKEGIND